MISSSSRRLFVRRPSGVLRKSSGRTRVRYFSSAQPTDRLVVVGSGVAGSATALIAAEKYKIPVSLLFAGSIPHDCNSYWAQGGIIYENYQHGDSPELLAQDIVRAGAGLCQEDAVMKLAREGPSRVEELLLSGFPYAQVPFDTTTSGEGEELSLCLEASHAVPRILHYADHTGKVITQHMTAAAANHPLITLVPDTLVTDLLTSDDGSTCLGVETLHRPTNQTSTLYASRGTVLCAGGLGGIYQHSTNPAGFNALGSSVALVERLAAAATTKTLTQDLEYVQFHPTSLCIPHEARFLLTEALRGEGAILRNAEGYAGKVITQHMTAAAANHPLITLVPDTLVTDLLTSDDGSTCLGVETLHRPTNQTSTLYASRGTVLCAGGLGGIYQHSTNPAGFNALGSSVALVERLAAATATTATTASLTQDLEYVQFHPTSLCIPHEARFLLTEALRGEGAILRNAEGYAFARDFHPDGELAPRDIVARGVFAESQKTSTSSGKIHNVFLDITHRDPAYLRQRFPTIQTHLQSRGLDLTHDHLPVIPAAHYTCGGISTDLQGRTGLTNLYAAGEAARTGLHGGNRLASTSLLEGLVYGAAVADYCGSSEGQDLHDHVQGLLGQQPPQSPHHDDDVSSSSASSTSSPDAIVSHATTLLQTVRSVMWDHVGVVRTPLGIAKALEALESIQQESEHLVESYKCMETVGVRDAAFAGQAVARAALANPHSAGAHFIQSDDEEEQAAVDTTVPPRRRMDDDESDDSDSDEDERTPVAAQ
eukprot:CAMPEP_0195305982 /NCGR_PEP_ID=MMETSP0707-20130614/36967_1 /TAXON_ID=33640 /ORGANISM="Asterionellopsis glacialis, Strain CCMP134" /LENGTH=768 /DNA_ID=CAMNT_0040370191 /DNA_START=270 /DNA_END=2577 /DNA_ORIENTATION=-